MSVINSVPQFVLDRNAHHDLPRSSSVRDENCVGVDVTEVMLVDDKGELSFRLIFRSDHSLRF
jgi:hypothetical protein